MVDLGFPESSELQLSSPSRYSIQGNTFTAVTVGLTGRPVYKTEVKIYCGISGENHFLHYFIFIILWTEINWLYTEPRERHVTFFSFVAVATTY